MWEAHTSHHPQVPNRMGKRIHYRTISWAICRQVEDMKEYKCRCIDCCQLDKELGQVVQGPSYSKVNIKSKQGVL